MSIQSETIDYKDGETVCRGRMFWDAARSGTKPCVLVGHDWRGRTETTNDWALEMAKLGYVGFAIDVYGGGKTGSNADENAALMNPFVGDRLKLQNRLLAAYEAAKSYHEVKADKVSMIGLCFGGMCALDLARSGADVCAAVSFHGLFAPNGLPAQKIKASVLALHGYDDPMAPPESMLALAEEMKAADADWQIHAYGRTAHSFTNEAAADPENGMQYSPKATERAVNATKSLLAETFAAR